MIARVAAFVGVVAISGFFVPQSFGQATTPFGQGAVHPGNGIKPPVLLHQVEPAYTPDAMKRRIEGDVELEAVIGVDGSVREVRISRGLDAGLDAEAIKAARGWLFKPGLDTSGQPVPVIVTLIVSFRMQGNFLNGVCTDGPGLVRPTLLQSVEPKYTADALRARLEGSVVVEAVVDPDGSVIRARVVESLDKVHGLDDEALKAARQFRYVPNSGTCHGGTPTLTLVRLTLTFRIH